MTALDQLKAQGIMDFRAQRTAQEVQTLALEGVPVAWTVAAVETPGAYTIVRTTMIYDSAVALYQRMVIEGTAPAYVLLGIDPSKPSGWRELARSTDVPEVTT